MKVAVFTAISILIGNDCSWKMFWILSGSGIGMFNVQFYKKYGVRKRLVKNFLMCTEFVNCLDITSLYLLILALFHS